MEEGGVMTGVYQIRAAARYGSIGVSLLALACVAPAHAPTADAENPSDIVVTATATTATQTDTHILSIPQAIEVVSSEDTQARGAHNIREAPNYTAGGYHGSAE